MLGFDDEYPAVQPKAKFWHSLVKNREKSAEKHSIEKPILLDFGNLSPTFCPRLKADKLWKLAVSDRNNWPKEVSLTLF